MGTFRDRSINRMIKSAFTGIILIMSISFIYSNFMKNKIVKEYNQFIKVNIELGDLSLAFNDSWAYFESCVNSYNGDTHDNFLESNIKFKKIMEEIAPYVKQDKNSGIFYNNLTHMFDWYEEQTSKFINLNEMDASSYEQLMKIKLMSFYISKHTNSLISSYLQFTDANYSVILDRYQFLDQNIYIMLIITILLSIYLVRKVIHDIIITIDKLSISANQLSAANWDIPDINGNVFQELKELTNTFNHMKNSLKSYIEQINKANEIEINYQNERIKNIEKDKIIREIQLKGLQMQMNPHFLFNNLNTVSRMAMFEGADQTVDLIDALSQILRYSLINSNNLVKLEEEIKNAKAYILIQKTKYEDRIKFSFDIEDGIDQVHIPPMSIQILIENAIKHGFSGDKKTGNIVISARRSGDYCKISVFDDGSGITKEDLVILNSGGQIKRRHKKSTGLGIKNIQKGLEIYYNRKDLLKIESEYGLNTRISFLIPIKESEVIAENINS